MSEIPDADDVAALRDGAAVARPGQRALFGISGEEHVEWFERIASMPVADLGPDRARWCTLMDGKGKLRADVRVIRSSAYDGLLLEVPASHATTLLRVLDMYILRDKVVLEDRSAGHGFISALGPGAAAALEQAGLPRAEADAVATDGEILALASRLYGVPGTDLIVPESESETVIARLAEAGARPVSAAALGAVRIAHGVPWFAEDMAEGVIPLEVGLHEHVSITKGCYPGQEVVARIVNLGQVARKLVRLTAAGHADLAAGTELLGTGEREGKAAGVLTSSAYDPAADRTVALGFVRRPWFGEGASVSAGGTELSVAGEARPALD